MSKPQYANAFTVSFNKNLNEVVIGFAQEYPHAEVSSPVSENNETTPPLEFSTIREDICGVVIPEEIARQLVTILGNTLNQQESAGH
ncbi:hypothetical protein [Flavonifractor sp. An82]|uniref:hypothetical protein n=1 Tax=Flavonifractor sp. An82 TaxID=1965660 RepID=UPI00111EAA40|nr:hypothetical protein [Flavonifractor sp. An82]